MMLGSLAELVAPLLTKALAGKIACSGLGASAPLARDSHMLRTYRPVLL
jgi:hypothetical protein